MRTRNGSRRRVLSYDERVLWTTVTQSIAPLRKSLKSETEKSQTVKSQAPSKPQQTRHAAGSRAGSSKAIEPPPAAPVPRPPPLAALERRMKRRVARGHQAIDARLDLHGLTQAQAHAALVQFLRTASARGAKLVLVITGKGSKELNRQGESERGILRRQVPQWLAAPNLRKVVIGFEDAHIAHGGEGALYVRIRRSPH